GKVRPKNRKTLRQEEVSLARFQMKYRMSGRAKKAFRERQEIRCPRADGHDHSIPRHESAIVQHDTSHSAIMFVQPKKSAAFLQLDSKQFRLLDELCHHTAAFRVAGFEVEEAIRISLRI